MATNPVVKEDFDFKDIFPTCLYDFNTYSSKAINDDYKLDNTCSMIMMLLEPRRGISESYIAACRELVLYLDYIKTKRSSTVIELSCKYFSYKLKYLLNAYECNDKSTKNAYNKMLNPADKIHSFNVPNTCFALC